MKKFGFIFTEILLSLILAAAVAGAGVVAVDLKTDMFEIDKIDLKATIQTIPVNVKNYFSQLFSGNSQAENSKPENSTVSSQPSVQETSKETSKEKVETVPLAEEPENIEEQPEKLLENLSRYGYTVENSIVGNKIILIDANDTTVKYKAKMYCYEKSEKSEYWWNITGEEKPMTEDVYIGENGSDYEITDGSKMTPGGIFLAGSAFYISDKPDITYPMFQITEDTYWVTDYNSKYFNQKVEGTDDKDWSSAEHMISSEKSYRYGLVVNYNMTPAEEGKGSAVFLHCGNAPTEGCVAVPENIMKTIIEWLDSDSTVSIFITV